jgi:cobalt-precorrin 5A hydrolase/precorrin-3B C17-methyltransferase
MSDAMSGAKSGPAIVVLGAGGLAVAGRIRAELPGAALHGLKRRIPDAEVPFDDLSAHLRDLFARGVPIVGICAAGVLVRALATVLDDKRREPPVIAVAEDGSAVVPLLGGHHGANAMARDIAAALGVAPAITTAGDVRFGVALDEPPPGWRLANAGDAREFTAALLAGAAVRIEGDAPWLTAGDLPVTDAAEHVIHVTDQDMTGGPRTLIYHPKTLAVGVGCERGAAPDELVALVRRTLADAGLAPDAVAALVSIDVKSDEEAVHETAAALGVPARFFDPATLERETPRLANPSPAVFRAVGSHGVAEAAALAAAGAEGALVVAKRKSTRCTCAVARGIGIIEADKVGRARGTLTVVGIGPGDAAARTPEAAAAIEAATDVVGYRLYLDLLGPEADGQCRHGYELGEERVRVCDALALAAAGHAVALVSSGDAGIYAMASLVFELLATPEDAAWARVAVNVVPGISAMQAAAARIGAPLGHDFCAVSLSDLLTPWPAIERRLEAAAEGDFVVALYNPVSRRRRHQLARAAEILLAHRADDTPVVLARNLGRVGETVTVVSLAELVPDMADMLTLVIVGSTATKLVARNNGGVWVYTPRGYGDGAAAKPEDAEPKDAA